MEIVVQVENVDLNAQIGDRYTYDEDEQRVPLTIGEAIAERVAQMLTKDDSYKDLRQQIRDMRVEEMRARVVAELEAAFLQPVQKTSQWGEPTGNPTTLRLEIMKLAEKALEIPRPGYSSSYPRETNAVQQFLQREIEGVVKKELAEAMADEKAKVVAAVRAKAAELIAQAVKEGIGR